MHVFNYENVNQITTIKINDDVYFKAFDIANALGYTNKQQAIRLHVDDEDVKFFNEIEHANFNHVKKISNNGLTKFINESGVYSLILRSNLPSAKQFKRWITNEVLPSIRKTGQYKKSQDEQDVTKITKIRLGYDFLKEVNMLSDRDISFLGSQVKNLVMQDKLLTNDENNNENNNENDETFDYPLTRRLQDHNIKYTKSMKGKLIQCGKMLKRLYYEKYNSIPPKRNQYVDNAIREVYCYTHDDFDIMDKALHAYFEF